MIFSKKHKFIFIKGRKAAGTSLEIALATICGPEDIITPIGQQDEMLRVARGAHAQNYSSDPAAERAYIETLKATPVEKRTKVAPPDGPYGNHMPLTRVLELCGDVRGEYRIFGVVRNPYSKVLSLANMHAAEGLEYRKTGLMRSTPEQLREEIERLLAGGALRKLLVAKQFRGPEGKIDVEVLHYENLAEEFERFLRSLGIEEPPALPHAKKGLMADDIDPSTILTPDEIRRINDRFSGEFKSFGYKMIEPQTEVA